MQILSDLFNFIKNTQYRYFNAINFAGFLSAIAYAYLALQSQNYGEAGLFDLYLTSFIVCIASITAWTFCYFKNIPITLSVVFFWAIVFRIIGIFGFPILEDDFFRYLWDGYQFITNGSPYAHPPMHYFANDNIPGSFEAILDGINYPHINTVYGPLNQWLFALSYLISPGEIWPLQLILSLFDLLLIYLLSRVAEAKYILLYAWNPLTVKEIAFTAHPDIVGIFFIMAAIILFRKHIYFTAICCALAVSSKIFAVIIVPLLIGFRWRAWGLFILMIVIISIPFINDFSRMPDGLASMAELWLFNAPIYYLLLHYMPVNTIKLSMLLLFTSCWIIYAFYYLNSKSTERIIRGDVIFGIFLLCIPVLNPWYLLWLLPFAVLHPTFSAWISSLAILLAYAIGLNLQMSGLSPYSQPTWAIVTQFCIIALAIIVDIFMFSKRMFKSSV
jgi:hypothetical protein